MTAVIDTQEFLKESDNIQTSIVCCLFPSAFLILSLFLLGSFPFKNYLNSNPWFKDHFWENSPSTWSWNSFTGNLCEDHIMLFPLTKQPGGPPNLPAPKCGLQSWPLVIFAFISCLESHQAHFPTPWCSNIKQFVFLSFPSHLLGFWYPQPKNVLEAAPSSQLHFVGLSSTIVLFL